jgi:hypothetical protein
MANVHGKNVVLFLGAYDLTGYFKKAATAHQVAKADTTVFGLNDETSLPGIKSATVNMDGYWDPAAGASHAVLAPIVGTAGQVLTLGQNGSTLGSQAELAAGYEAKYENSADIGSAIGATAEVDVSGGLFYGVFQHAKGVETTTGNSASVDGGAATTNGWVANQHIFTISGTGSPTLTGKIQDSADNSSFVDLAGGAFAAATAVGAQQISGSNTVRQYTREVHTISGTGPSFTYATALARK